MVFGITFSSQNAARTGSQGVPPPPVAVGYGKPRLATAAARPDSTMASHGGLAMQEPVQASSCQRRAALCWAATLPWPGELVRLTMGEAQSIFSIGPLGEPAPGSGRAERQS